MMKDANDLHSIAAEPVKDAMLIADEATDVSAEIRPRGAAARMRGEAFESVIDGVLIGVGGSPTELCFPKIADFHEISVCRPAQDDLSHVARDVRRRSP